MENNKMMFNPPIVVGDVIKNSYGDFYTVLDILEEDYRLLDNETRASFTVSKDFLEYEIKTQDTIIVERAGNGNFNTYYNFEIGK